MDDATIDYDLTFADLTTLKTGGKPEFALRCFTSEAITRCVSLLDDANVPVLIIGGGSNLVVADGDLDLVAVILETEEIDVDLANGIVTAEAGAKWDDVVAIAVSAGLGGIECLSGIPGSAGATPIQNVGAYGVEISSVLTKVKLFNRLDKTVSWVDASELNLRYRNSNLKNSDRAIVLEIELQLRTDGQSAPLRFGELSRRLAVSEAEAARGEVRRPAQLVRETVLELRRSKGMLTDESDHDTWSVGSFFTNPVVDTELADSIAAKVGGDDGAKMPRFTAGGNTEKLSAAWLIEHANFAKGYPGEGAPARLSTKHTLAITNRGQATTADVVALAQEIRDGVLDIFGVEFVPESVWVEVSLLTE